MVEATKYLVAYKTKFVPKNLKKYVGNPRKITCRSLWERKVCKFLDENENVLLWSFEGLKIPYVSPLDGKIHSYIPDFLARIKKNDKIINYILEVKPEKQTYLKENAKPNIIRQFKVNYAKFEAADAFCKRNGMQFEILTERHIFHGQRF